MFFEKGRQVRRSVSAYKLGSADQTGYNGGQGRRGITGRFFPALLLSDRSMTHQKARGTLDEREHVEFAQTIELPQPPRKDDRKGHFIQLDARPVRCAVDPEVLREATIRFLGAG